jgi:membrane protein
MSGALPGPVGPEVPERGHGHERRHRRGHDAPAPHRIPLRGWLQVLGRAGRHVLDDRLMALAAAVSFFAVLSIAPLLVTALSVYGAVNTPEQAVRQLAGLSRMLPTEVQPVVADQLTTITTSSTQVHTRRGLTGLALALWTATAAMTYLIDALTVAYHEDESRGFGRRTRLALVFVLGGALLLGGVIAAVGIVSRALDDAPAAVRGVAPLVIWMALALLMAAGLAVLYRFAPDRRQARWRWISWGAATATVLWLAASVALFAYVRSLGTYESTYGSLAGVAISMFWLWVSVALVLLGATINAETERQTARDSTVGTERPIGEREAVVADSAPPYTDEG